MQEKKISTTNNKVQAFGGCFSTLFMRNSKLAPMNVDAANAGRRNGYMFNGFVFDGAFTTFSGATRAMAVGRWWDSTFVKRIRKCSLFFPRPCSFKGF